MAVYYKFKSAKDFDSIPIDGHFISVGTLKERIFESKQLGRGKDFDLMVSNAQTDEEYADEATLIPKNTSLLIRRVPGCPRKPIFAQQDEPKVEADKEVDVPQHKGGMLATDSSAMKPPEESEWDEFGNDLYTIPEVLPVQSSYPVVSVPPNIVDEDKKIQALIETPSLDWKRQTQDAYVSGRGFGRGMGGRMMGGRGFGRGMFERKTPPEGYICHRCKVPGHFIQHCPTNGDPNYDMKKPKPPTGIPKSMLMATPDGSYALPSGAVAVLKPNEAAFEKEIEGLPFSRPTTDLPPELHCPLCKEVMKDAVLTSKCCFSSFCDKCIRDYIILKAMCVCGAKNILADDLLPNKTLRETINRILESTSSTEKAGSLFQVQDMESARPAQPKAPSPTLSATSKEHTKPPNTELVHMKESRDESEGKGVAVAVQSLEKNTKAADLYEATPESMKETTSQESARLPQEEIQEKLLSMEQGKKKKKKRICPPVSAADMQLRAFQDVGAENFVGMPMAPPAYNPYSMAMPWGMDGYMAHFPGMPMMGYTPGPFDSPYGGILLQDPFGPQGYMMPPVLPQRDLSEFNMGAVNRNIVPHGMSREEIEARKADLRRKREIQRHSERDRSKDREISRDLSSSMDIYSQRPKTRLPSQAAVPSAHRGERPRTPDRHRPRSPDKSGLARTERAKSPEQHHGPAHADRPKSSERHGLGRAERAVKTPSLTREEAARRRSPTRTVTRWKAEHEKTTKPLPEAEQKSKGSVFSRISFPGGGGDGSAKKRKSAEKDREPTTAGHGPSSSGYRAEVKPTKSSMAAGIALHDDESSEEDEEEYHFKRRPSGARHEAADATEDGRAPRERERLPKWR